MKEKEETIILFDLDGTLIDSTEAILESFHNSYAYYGEKAPTDEEIKALIGHPLDVMYSRLGIEESKVWDYVHTYKMHYRKISCAKTQLLPFAKETISAASKFARLGIVTTKTAKYSRELLEHFGLMSNFETLIGREHVENPKPHKEPVLKALSEMNATKSNSWLIGDTHLDIVSAKNAEINHIAVTSGYETKSQLLEHTDKIVDNALLAVESIRKNV